MIIITGGSGLLGNAFKKVLSEAVFPSHKQLDLTDPIKTANYFANYNIDTVIHLAGKVGGVKANTQYISDFYQVNSEINNNVISLILDMLMQNAWLMFN